MRLLGLLLRFLPGNTAFAKSPLVVRASAFGDVSWHLVSELPVDIVPGKHVNDEFHLCRRVAVVVVSMQYLTFHECGY